MVVALSDPAPHPLPPPPTGALATPPATSPGHQELRRELLLRHLGDAADRVATLARRAARDPLTGMATRHQFVGDVAGLIGVVRLSSNGLDDALTVMAVELDNHAYVDDAFGPGAADRLVAGAAERLMGILRPDDGIARNGRGGFVAMAYDLGGRNAARELAERARRVLHGRISFGEFELDLSASVGVALSGQRHVALADEHAASALVLDAEAAAQESIRHGRDRSTLFTAPLRPPARARADLAADLVRALDANALSLDYQPVFDFESRLAVGAAARLRWVAGPPSASTSSGEREIVDADEIHAIAVEAGFVGRLGDHVLERALGDLLVWQGRGLVNDRFDMHLTVSRLQLASPSFATLVVDRLRSRSIDARRLVIETTSSGSSHPADVAADATIRVLRRLGVRVSTDAVGFGVVSTADAGADTVRLDARQVLGPSSSEADLDIVRALVTLAHALGIAVVAEHVDDVDQLRRLHAAGCDRFRGGVIGDPSDAEAIAFETTVRW